MDARTTKQTSRCNHVRLSSGTSAGAKTCNHQVEGAVRFVEGGWKCQCCGRRLQVAEAATGWQVFGQAGRYLAYCAVLAASIPVAMWLVTGKTSMTGGTQMADYDVPKVFVLVEGAKHADGLDQHAGTGLLVASH